MIQHRAWGDPVSTPVIAGCPLSAGTRPEVGRNSDAYRGARAAGVRQGGVGGASGARRRRGRSLCRAGKRRRAGRSAQGGGTCCQASDLPAGLLPQAGSLGAISRARARLAGDGVRHAVRAGGISQHPDQGLDSVSSLAAAEISRPERDQLADHPGRYRNRAVDLLARQRARYRRRAAAEENADLGHQLARLGLFRPAVSDGRRRRRSNPWIS